MNSHSTNAPNVNGHSKDAPKIRTHALSVNILTIITHNKFENHFKFDLRPLKSQGVILVPIYD